ncbi:plant auxinresponsive GH3-like protein [Acanthamoeba castellanii str. Neff]|uniref:Plant auxinresponsive GH3-like protein n=1 Tax=Acanthamoeba castellanii (strain ATCC 30010 / Neff) TaxID=1257118 RepID=L8HIQ4_ACACF|nr:plant auxinresponsive GH3-like protein [Acanthamoeba castellanii str. Neff]ELR25484.1 plant auxinresponsive GH3-like protein [Acanthamoeba castellanii str. Neff]
MWLVAGWAAYLGAWSAAVLLAAAICTWAFGAGLLRVVWVSPFVPLLLPNPRGWRLLLARTLPPRQRDAATAPDTTVHRGWGHGWGWAGWRGVWLGSWLGAAMSGLGWFARRSLVAALRDGARASNATLAGIVRLNAHTTFGRRYGFEELMAPLASATAATAASKVAAEREVVEAFKVAVPLATYYDLAPWVAQVAGGEQNVLTSESIIQLGVTSGTSYSKKQLPVTQRQKTNFFFKGIAPLFDVLFTHFPQARGLQKSLKIMFQPTYSTSPGGIKVGANSSAPSDSPTLLNMYTTPPVAYEIMSEPDLLYVHLLFALKDEYLGSLEANFVMLIHHLFVRMEKQWRQAVEDIERGRVSAKVQMPDHVRRQLEDYMAGPDVSRARMLTREFEAGFEGIARSFSLYAERARYYLGDVPIYSPLYAATEGLLGVNLDPKGSAYYLVPSNMFIEFIPLDHCDQEQPPTLGMDEVEAGQSYELAVTTAWGLYRYRLGDVVQVVGFFEDGDGRRGAPLIEFGYRLGQLLNVRGEKTSERAMAEALRHASALEAWRGRGAGLVDYCCVDPAIPRASFLPPRGESDDDDNEDEQPRAPHYDLFVELEEENEAKNTKNEYDEELWARRAEVVDEELCRSNPIYRSFRVKNGIGRVVVHGVRAGTFDELRATILRNGAPPNQVKVPRVVRDPSHLACLARGLLVTAAAAN